MRLEIHHLYIPHTSSYKYNNFRLNVGDKFFFFFFNCFVPCFAFSVVVLMMDFFIHQIKMKGDEKMNQGIKKILVSLLAFCLLTTPVFSVSTAAVTAKYSIAPLYNNTATVLTSMAINNSGKMSINYNVAGFSSLTTKISITTYIEKKTLGLFWMRVDNGQANEQWVDTIYDYKYNGSRTYQLASSGTYRVTVVYKVYGSGGSADEIEYQKTDSY